MSAKEQPRRLGRGLAALLGDSAVPESVAAPGVQLVAVDQLEPSPFQPRRAMDETALGELADSIGQRGILQPLLVRPKPGLSGAYQIIAGERRWRAAQRAQLHEVPVLVRELSDADAMAAGLVENLQREDLNAVEEAEGYRRLMAEFNIGQEKLGEAVGKSRQYINNIVRILKLPPKVLDMVRDGRLSLGHAKALLGQPHDLADSEKLAKQILKRELSVRQAEVMIGDLGRTMNTKLREEIAKRNARTDLDIEAEALARDLTERLGLHVMIKHKGRGGTVMLNYRDLNQLDALIQLLNG